MPNPGPSPKAAIDLLGSQICFHPELPKSSFEGQTIIVTGANTGLGREAAKHFVQLHASRVILAVRTQQKGNAALEYIENETGRHGIAEVWPLDMSDFASVKTFSQRAAKLSRLDAVVQNAGMWPKTFELTEGHEATIAVNVISVYLLARLIMPKLEETALSTNITPRMTVVSTALHKFATLQARNSKAIFDDLKNPYQDFGMRYNDSKLLAVLYGSKLAAVMVEQGSKVCLNFVSPGWCISNLQPANGPSRIMEKMLARSTDEGSRLLVHAVSPEKASDRHGAYLDDAKIKKPAAWMASDNGRETADRVWTELNTILDTAIARQHNEVCTNINNEH